MIGQTPARRIKPFNYIDNVASKWPWPSQAKGFEQFAFDQLNFCSVKNSNSYVTTSLVTLITSAWQTMMNGVAIITDTHVGGLREK